MLIIGVIGVYLSFSGIFEYVPFSGIFEYVPFSGIFEYVPFPEIFAHVSFSAVFVHLALRCFYECYFLIHKLNIQIKFIQNLKPQILSV